MSAYTIQIEAHGGGVIWQAIRPSETVNYDRTVQELADEVMTNQTVVEEGCWRVRVWDDANADTSTEPNAIYTYIS